MGTGSINFSTSDNRFYIDLSVSATYNVSALELPEWQTAFEFASEELFTATLGRMQLGSIGFSNNGSWSADGDDVFLYDRSDKHSSSKFKKHRIRDSPVLDWYIKLTQLGKTHPLEIVHEIGHYVVGLADEYYRDVGASTTYRCCTNDPSTGACIMEHAFENSVVLGSGGAIQSTPATPVSKFCSSEHLVCTGHSTSFCTTYNSQQSIHSVSCWDTFVKHYSHFSSPPTSTDNTLRDINWFPKSNIQRNQIAIFGTSDLIQRGVLSKIKGGLIAWARLVFETDNELALLADLAPNSFVIDMQSLSQGAELDTLISQINSLETGNSNLPSVPFQLNQFDENAIAAYQSMVIVVPGDLDLNIGNRTDTEVRALFREFEKRHVNLVVITLGTGKFSKLISRLQGLSSRVKHIGSAENTGELNGFSLQTALVESFYDTSIGMGIVASKSDLLPRRGFEDLQEPGIVTEDGMVDGNLDNAEKQEWMFSPKKGGFDFPIMIEEGANSATFFLCKTENGNLEFELIHPLGHVVDVDSDGVFNFGFGENVNWYTVPNVKFGRWIMRIRRTVKGAVVPFHLFVVVENPRLDLLTFVETDAQTIRFEATAHLDSDPIHNVQSTVDVYSFDESTLSPKPILSIALNPERDFDPVREADYELISGEYHGAATLDPGEYVAVFRVSSYGNSIVATNPESNRFGSSEKSTNERIPAFNRIQKKYFSVVE